jgi:hypothetical protein
MNSELTNLLPIERQKDLRREYFFRMGVVIIVSISLLTLIASVLLIPTYVFLSGDVKAKKEQLENIKSQFSSSDEASLSSRLAALSSDAASLIALSNTKSVGTIIRGILAIPHPGISLLNFSYVTPSGLNSKAVTISGISATRSSLRNYQLSLQSDPSVLSAVLPVSAYAKDTEIAFTITITLAS